MSNVYSIDAQFTGLFLAAARREAQKAGVSVPKGLTTWSHQVGSNKYYEVWADGDIVWSGTAYNANEAKANYINQLINEKEKNDVA